MGTNKRYPEAGAKRREERELEELMASCEPLSLTNDELELRRQPVTRTPMPEPVTAWVRYGDRAVQVRAKAVAWTPRAMAITWESPAGVEYRAWVWASAVEKY